jgi:DNA-binding response OmpR family regulator
MLIKALVIDDDTLFANFLKDALTAEGFEVFIAGNGPEGIEITRRLKPDVIVLDLMLPEVDGWQVCRTIRTFSRVPILMLSAVVDSQGVMRALEHDADDYLIKPVPAGVLVTRLKRLARQARINQKNEAKQDE